jgi:hypothetical protein
MPPSFKPGRVVRPVVIIVPKDKLRLFAENEEVSRLQEIVGWIAEHEPAHPVAKLLQQHGSLTAARPFIEKALKNILERQLYGSEIRRFNDGEEPGVPAYGRKRAEKIGTIGLSRIGTLPKVQWRYADGRLDGTETIFHALDANIKTHQSILSQPEKHHKNKSLRAHELEAFILCRMVEEQQVQVNARLEKLKTESKQAHGLLEGMMKSRIGSFHERVWWPNYLANDAPGYEMRPRRRTKLLAGIGGTLMLGGLLVNNYVDFAWNNVADSHRTSDGALDYEGANREFLANPLFNALDHIEGFDGDINYLSSKAIVHTMDSLGFVPPKDMANAVEDTEELARLRQTTATTSGIDGLNAGIGNVGKLGKNVPIVHLESFGLSTEGYWATGRYEFLFDVNEWWDSDYLQAESVFTFPKNINSVPSIRAVINNIELFSTSTSVDQLIFEQYDLLRLPIRTGTRIAAAHLENETGTLNTVVAGVTDAGTGETYVLVPRMDNYRDVQLVYQLVFDDSNPVRFLEEIEGDDPVDGTSDRRVKMTQEAYIAESLKIWEQYIPGISDFSPEAQTAAMAEYIRNGEYSLNPLKDGDIQRGADIVAATLRNGKAICNTANTTMVLSSEEMLAPVGGFLNADNSRARDGSGLTVISSNEAHMWAVNQYGKIIDATPSRSSENLSGFTEDTTQLPNGNEGLPSLPYAEIGIAAAGVSMALGRRKLWRFGRFVGTKRAQRRSRNFDMDMLSQLYHKVNGALFAPKYSLSDPLFHGSTATTPKPEVMHDFLADVSTRGLRLHRREHAMLRTIKKARR